MNKKLKEFFQKAREVRLQKEEKSLGYKTLLTYIETNPVRFLEDVRHQWQRSIFLIQPLQFFYKPMAIIAIVLLVAVASGGSVSLAAENAFPGDLLYPVKVEFNENVRAALAFSQEAKAEWKVEQVQRRLQEADKLAVKGSLDGEIAGKLETKFEQHVERAWSIASKLQVKGKTEAAAEIHSNLEAALEAHKKILLGLKNEEKDERVEQILAKVEVKTQEAKAALIQIGIDASTSAPTPVSPTQPPVAPTQPSAAETSIVVEDHPSDTREATIKEVRLQHAGYVVIHQSENGSAGSIVGHSGLLQPGVHTNVKVAIDPIVIGQNKLFAMVHVDNGDGIYNFPPDDVSVKVNGEVVAKAFTLTFMREGQLGPPPTGKKGSLPPIPLPLSPTLKP